jgi:GH43 family beta-xylosidase
VHDFRSGDRAEIWRPPPGTAYSTHIWAPELHLVDGVWFVYVAAASPVLQTQAGGAPPHRPVVLRCAGTDPMVAADWALVGPIRNAPDHWGIDATMFCPPADPARRFVVWSGWQLGDDSDTQQDLFIMELRSPEEAVEGTYACIARAELPWERAAAAGGATRGICEGPTFVRLADDSWRGIVYSANGSWDAAYCLGLLELVDEANPCDAASWRKRAASPLLVSDPARRLAPFGPGHASFVHSTAEDDRTVLCVHHATDAPTDGWANRKGYVLPLPYDAFGGDATAVCNATGVMLAMGAEAVEAARRWTGGCVVL